MASFEEHGIPLVPDEYKSSYLESLEVMIMLDTLRAINNPLMTMPWLPSFVHLCLTSTRTTGCIAVQADKGQFYDKLLAAY
ncbi:MAG: hypothetical protein ACLUFP_07270 [Streptococcus salivarius]